MRNDIVISASPSGFELPRNSPTPPALSLGTSICPRVGLFKSIWCKGSGSAPRPSSERAPSGGLRTHLADLIPKRCSGKNRDIEVAICSVRNRETAR